MDIAFKVGDRQVHFKRSWLTGAASVVLDGQRHTLVSPTDLTTHFSFELKRQQICEVDGHRVRVEHTRPQYFAAFRPHSFRVYVDDVEVAAERGY